MELTLAYKIKALIEGLSDVAALGKAFLTTAAQAESLKSVTSSVEAVGTAAKGAQKDVDSAFSSLGGRSVNNASNASESTVSSATSFSARATRRSRWVVRTSEARS